MKSVSRERVLQHQDKVVQMEPLKPVLNNNQKKLRLEAIKDKMDQKTREECKLYDLDHRLNYVKVKEDDNYM